jgi:hypothetical protein
MANMKNLKKTFLKKMNMISFILLLCIILFVIWQFTRKEGLETKTDGSGCLVTDKSVDDEDMSFNVNISCKEFKDVLMGSNLQEYASLAI